MAAPEITCIEAKVGSERFLLMVSAVQVICLDPANGNLVDNVPRRGSLCITMYKHQGFSAEDSVTVRTFSKYAVTLPG
jgi:hypothetical protein